MLKREDRRYLTIRVPKMQTLKSSLVRYSLFLTV